MAVAEELLDISGIGRKRMALRWVSAAEGQIFADTVSDLTRTTQDLGPFDRERYKMQLAAVENVLTSARLRWLTGMERQITEKMNVYNEKIDDATYRAMMKQAALEEYEKAMLLEVLREGPQSVREMASKAGLPVYTVSIRLNDLERRGQAELKGYEGSTPKFIRLAA
jgi:F420-non-reducing hydrogenase iron-sulfur subunit